MVSCFSYCINGFQWFTLQFSVKYTDGAFFYHISGLLAFLSYTCRQCSLTSSRMTKRTMTMLRQWQPRHTYGISLAAGIATSLRPCVETVCSGAFAAVTVYRKSGSTRCCSEEKIGTDPIQRTGSWRRSDYGILFRANTSKSTFRRR